MLRSLVQTGRPAGSRLAETPGLRAVTILSEERKTAPRPLFPLPLSSCERLFLDDELPSFPMQFFCRLRLTGRLQQAPLEEALLVALARHPLLTAIVKDEDQPHWATGPRPLPLIDFREEDPAESYPAAVPLDLRKQPGLKVTVVRGADRADIILQFHHAACDGVGAFDFTTDLLTAYANAVKGTNHRLRPFDPDRLRTRGQLPFSGWKLARWTMRRLPSLRTAWRFFRRKPVAVVPHRPEMIESAPPAMYPEVCLHRFDRAESAALARLARGAENTLNSLLVRDLLLALGQWRRQQQLPEDDYLRLMIPMNLRTHADRRTPAANLLSMFFLDHCPAAAGNPAALLHDIHRLLDEVKQNDLGMAWLLALRGLQNLMPRHWAKARRSQRRCLYSTVLTNLGPVLAGSSLPRVDRRLRVGPMTLEAVDFIPIVRPLQCVGFAVSNYAGQITLALRYDSRVLTTAQGREVLNLFVEALRVSMQTEDAGNLPRRGPI